MKQCSKCSEVKNTSEFRKHSGTKDGFQHQCKMCQSAYYYNSPRYQEKQRTGTKLRRLERQKIVNEFKATGCKVCGYDRCLAAIDCHHVEEKDSLIPDLVKRRVRLDILMAELNKCVPLCSRCHRELHDGVRIPLAV